MRISGLRKGRPGALLKRILTLIASPPLSYICPGWENHDVTWRDDARRSRRLCKALGGCPELCAFLPLLREGELLTARPIVAMALAGREAKLVHHKEGIDPGQSPSDHDTSLASF
jgi:hypothetical protein